MKKRNFYKFASVLVIVLLSSAFAWGQLSPPNNLTATMDPVTGEVDLSWDYSIGTGQWIQWNTGLSTGNGIGLASGGTFSVASHWMPSDLAIYDGMSVTQMSFFPNEDPNASFTLKVWTGANAATAVMSQEISSYTVDEFNVVYLTNTVTIDASMEYWFGYEITHGAGTKPAGIDEGPAEQGLGDMVSLNGTTWVSMATYGFDFNWNIGI